MILTRSLGHLRQVTIYLYSSYINMKTIQLNLNQQDMQWHNYLPSYWTNYYYSGLKKSVFTTLKNGAYIPYGVILYPSYTNEVYQYTFGCFSTHYSTPPECKKTPPMRSHTVLVCAAWGYPKRCLVCIPFLIVVEAPSCETIIIVQGGRAIL